MKWSVRHGRLGSEPNSEVIAVKIQTLRALLARIA